PRHSAGGRAVVPGLIDSHAHLAFAGDRSGEFTERLGGTSYLDIARRGGGIAATVRATRAASEQALYDGAREVLAFMRARGVTTVEAKSGYGLDVETELRTLRLYRRLNTEGPQRIVPTCLGAHVVPPEHRDDRAAYLRLLTDEMIPRVAREELAVFFDVFVEDTAFTPDEARALFAAARAHGLTPKLHADQLTDTGGAQLAAEVGAASADHLERISEAGIAAMAKAGVVAGSLPIATLVLGQEPLPARALIDAGVPVAVATDLNPGSAPSPDLHLAAWLACTRQRMTPHEVLKGLTAWAARSLRLEHQIGSLEPGKVADVVVLDASSVEAWLYDFRPGPVARTIIGGETVWEKAAE
ncbi:MAG TPA: imidazolonepropionase, partial [Rhodothermales bacterium]|nr:imidazolonepropionase [Rhodothermales bacterium]